jgi:predicted hydrolase (HD superfamily)
VALTRFELYIIVKIQVSDRALRRRQLAVEAAMEELAPALALDPALARLAGLAAGIDAQLCRRNPERRGTVAAEFLVTEGAPTDVVEAVLKCWREPAVERLSRLATALVAAEAIVDVVHAALDAGDRLDDLADAAIAGALRRAAERRGDPAAVRAQSALARLDLDPERAAGLALAAMRRVRGDLGL